MADEIQGKKMSEYTTLNELTQQEQVTYLSNAAVTTFGKTSPSGENTNVNVPLSAIKPDVPVTDVTVDGVSVVANGVAAITTPSIPTAADLAGNGLNANGSKLDVATRVPAPGVGDVGKVLTVDDSDAIVWDEVPSSQPNYGEGLEYDSNTNTLKFSYLGSGGLMYEQGHDETRGMKVKAGNGIKVNDAGVSIDTDTAEDGQVLSYDDTTQKIKWVNAGGGGGGGNPYTKVNVTPAYPYADGGEDSYGNPSYQQDIVINNNTYDVSTIPLACYKEINEETGEEYSWYTSRAVQCINIKLPAGTEFPMAVVEFAINDDTYSYTNNLKVFVGNTELTKMFASPYNEGIILGSLYEDRDTHRKTVEIDLHKESDPTQSNPDYSWSAAYNNSLHSRNDVIGSGVKAQVIIFGSCFRVLVNKSSEAGS